MFKKITTVAVAGLMLASLAGCTNGDTQKKNDDMEATFTIAPVSMRDNIDYDKQQVQVLAKNKAEVHMGGSGSCPPEISRVEINGDVIALQLKDWGDRVCTMDYRPYSQLITTTSTDIDLNDYEFEVCTPMNECNKLVKNYKNNTTTKA